MVDRYFVELEGLRSFNFKLKVVRLCMRLRNLILGFHVMWGKEKRWGERVIRKKKKKEGGFYKCFGITS